MKQGRKPKSKSEKTEKLTICLPGWLLDLLGQDNSERRALVQKIVVRWGNSKK